MCAAALLPLCGCDEDEEISGSVSETPETGEYIDVRIGLGGDLITVSEDPLTKAIDTDDITWIQIYDSDGDPYAYGLFDDVSDITVSLKAGETYSFEASTVIDGKIKLAYGEGYYSSPFAIWRGNSGWVCS